MLRNYLLLAIGRSEEYQFLSRTALARIVEYIAIVEPIECYIFIAVEQFTTRSHFGKGSRVLCFAVLLRVITNGD